MNSHFFLSTYANDMYPSSFLRLPVWLIGVATGYVVFKYKNEKFVIPKIVRISFWILSIIILNSVVFGQIILNRNENSYLSSAFFNAFGRPLWSLTICWTIFACATDNAETVNSFLSLPIFNFAAKITYSVFLVHFMVILIIAGRRRHIDHFNNLRAIHEFCGDAIFSIVFGLFFSLIFESPIITLAKKLFSRFEEVFKEDGTNPPKIVIQYKMWFIPVSIYMHTKVE